MSKGIHQRPTTLSQEEFRRRWEKVFGRKKKVPRTKIRRKGERRVRADRRGN